MAVVGTFRTWSDVRLESGMRSKADVKNRLRSDRRSGCRDLIQVIVARRDQPHWVEQPIHFLRVQLPSQKGPRQATRWMAEGAHSLLRQRHMPRIRAPMSMRGPWLAGRAAAPAIAIGQTVFSNRPSKRSGMKRVLHRCVGRLAHVD